MIWNRREVHVWYIIGFCLTIILQVVSSSSSHSLLRHNKNDDIINNIISNKNNLLPILNDINFIVVTDVHSWVAGHGFHEPSLNADYGDVLSFYEHLATECNAQNKDLFFVMNGDFVDGTALSSSKDNYSHLIKILEKMPFDVMNIGNHELYHKDLIEKSMEGTEGFIDFWNGRYLTSNVLRKQDINSTSFLGNPYSFLKGENTNSTILCFGFLFNMKDYDHDSNIYVKTVEETLESDWFVNVLSKRPYTFDSILVLAHMDVKDSLVDKIHQKILQILKEKENKETMPIVFITGHTHYRGFHQIDDYSISFEAGKYLDTVGFVSYSLTSSQPNFEHKFLDANVQTLSEAVGQKKDDDSSFPTPNGIDLSNFIQEMQEQMNLTDILGCSPHTFYLNRTQEDSLSLWNLWLKKVIPTCLFSQQQEQEQQRSVFIANNQDFRYHLFKGKIRKTDLVSVSPFDSDEIVSISQNINNACLEILMHKLNEEQSYLWPVPNYMVSSSSIPSSSSYIGGISLYTSDFHSREIQDTLKELILTSSQCLEAQILDPPQVYEKGENESSIQSFYDLFEIYIQDNFICREDEDEKIKNNDAYEKKNDDNDINLIPELVFALFE